MKVVCTKSLTSPGSISPRTLRGASLRPNVVPRLNLTLVGSPSIRMVSSTPVGGGGDKTGAQPLVHAKRPNLVVAYTPLEWLEQKK